jgi:D-alanyl-D-alanine carboxypeptidase
MRGSFVLVGLLCTLGTGARASDLSGQMQTLADSYLAERQAPEKITAVSLHVDVPGQVPVNVWSGTYGGKHSRRIDDRTLFEIGSNTKHFSAAMILKLEAQGVLNIDQTLGQWLPQYPDWSRVTIRSLLNMTAPIPNYSETVAISSTLAANIYHQFSPEDLIGAAYDQSLPIPTGWFYSNTNYILAGMIIEAATHMGYENALKKMLLRPLHLRETYYENGNYPPRLQRRLPSGIYDNPACTLYQPQPCQQTSWQPIVGTDVSHMNMSWAGAAGAMIATPEDLARWVRDLFHLRVIPKAQLDEMTTLVSNATGQPITDVSADDPQGYGLGVARNYQQSAGGAFWFYHGESLSFRTIFAYWPQYDLIITVSTNSQPDDTQDALGPDVVVKAFETMQADGLLQPVAASEHDN